MRDHQVMTVRQVPNHVVARGKVHEPGDPCTRVWRVCHGALRLDQVDAQGVRFAGLALPGDLVGAESLLMGRYAYAVRALVPSVLEPWEPMADQRTQEALTRSLMQVQQRTADLMALRSGSAEQRVARLILMMAAQADEQFVRPILRDVADITDMTVESVSRVFTRLRQLGALVGKERGAHLGLRREILSSLGAPRAVALA
jgi:CRP-like cAMP-binding protein